MTVESWMHGIAIRSRDMWIKRYLEARRDGRRLMAFVARRHALDFARMAREYAR
jgi:hypothetical protein